VHGKGGGWYSKVKLLAAGEPAIVSAHIGGNISTVRFLSPIYQADINGAANFGIKNDENTDTVLSVLFAFFVMVFKYKTTTATRKCTFCQNILTLYCSTMFLCCLVLIRVDRKDFR
jgi:hypothetical protein